MDTQTKSNNQGGPWRIAAIVLAVVCLCLVIAVVAMTMTPKAPFDTCGDGASIDQTEPSKPGPFHDLTRHEINRIRKFLEKDSKINATESENARLNGSVVFAMDLFPAKKSAVLEYLDGKGKQPNRQARVIMFRGDLKPPVVQEYICGPLPKVTRCWLHASARRRNPVEFSLRPLGFSEFDAVSSYLLPKIENQTGFILKESYGTSFLDCKPGKCLKYDLMPIASNFFGGVSKRQFWMWASYDVTFYTLHPVDFQVLIDTSGTNPDNFTASYVWYSGQLFNSLEELVDKYNSGRIMKSKMKRYNDSEENFSSLHQRGRALPRRPQRPPTLVEPDGKRYSLKDRKVDYLGWTFNFRMSSLSGPSLHDVKYKGQRILYELALAEIAVFYSAHSPMHSTSDNVNSGFLFGSKSKPLVPGGDCPDSATFIDLTFSDQVASKPVEVPRAFCLFENNNGYPLRRHMAYAKSDGGFYGGMLDSVLTLRSAITVVNHDYIIDFVLHQNGVIETQVLNTGYVFPSVFQKGEMAYGTRLHENLVGNINHHMFHFKADLDIHGTSNRYETLNIEQKKAKMQIEPRTKYAMSVLKTDLKRTEVEALYKYNFNHPMYHVVHNLANKTKFKEISGYRIKLQGTSKQILQKDKGNEGAIPWARYQMAVTKHKDDEIVSSSPYALWDSHDPVTNFNEFIEDDENLVDEDLVFWLTLGMQHIPRSEDLPLMSTVDNKMTFYLSPFNYFDECPSMASRDQIDIHYIDDAHPKKGLKVHRYADGGDQCMIPNAAKAYDDLVSEDPDVVIESRKSRDL